MIAWETPLWLRDEGFSSKLNCPFFVWENYFAYTILLVYDNVFVILNMTSSFLEICFDNINHVWVKITIHIFNLQIGYTWGFWHWNTFILPVNVGMYWQFEMHFSISTHWTSFCSSCICVYSVSHNYIAYTLESSRPLSLCDRIPP